MDWPARRVDRHDDEYQDDCPPVAGTGDTPVAETRNHGRLLPVFNALNDIGVIATPVLYDEATAGDVRGQLLAVDAVLVWVDPIAGGQRREALDSLLREVSVTGGG